MRKVLFYGLAGAAVGLSANQALNLLLSYALHLGYYAPCWVALPEIAGGELNAVFLQMAVTAGAGGIAGVCAGVGKKRKMHSARKGSVRHERSLLSARPDQRSSRLSTAGSDEGQSPIPCNTDF